MSDDMNRKEASKWVSKGVISTDAGNAVAAIASAGQDNLPSWDLASLYAGIDDPTIASDMQSLEVAARKFSEEFRGKLSQLSAKDFGRALRMYESIAEGVARLLSFAFLQSAEDLGKDEHSRFRQRIDESLMDTEKETTFFALELNLLEEDALERLYGEDSSLCEYRAWIGALRRFRAHQLTESIEEVIAEKHLTSRQAWVKLYDDTESAMRFSVGTGNDMREGLTLSEVLHLLSDKSARVREDAARSLGTGLGKQLGLATMITNTLAQDKYLEDKRRSFSRPIDSRNLDNRISGDVVESLVSSVRSFYPRLSHRYYRLKARWLGMERLNYWDRGAPVPHADEGYVSWSSARELVLASYSRFSPRMGDIASRFFSQKWIDAAPRAGKMSGAFSHPSVPSSHPYILLSYRGKTRDVMTLAHELGHGVHQVLAAERGFLLSQTPLTLAETASVFGERLTFDLMLERASTLESRRALLAGKIEDMLNTVVRQISFLDFERIVHDERRAGPLSSKRLCDIWLEVSRASLGDIFVFGDEYRNYWSYISHFIHAPFYVYSYAFGDCLVNVLYGLYMEGCRGDGSISREDFSVRYLSLLESGGSCDYRELLSGFGLCVTDADFWSRGLMVVESMIEDLEGLLEVNARS